MSFCCSSDHKSFSKVLWREISSIFIDSFDLVELPINLASNVHDAEYREVHVKDFTAKAILNLISTRLQAGRFFVQLNMRTRAGTSAAD